MMTSKRLDRVYARYGVIMHLLDRDTRGLVMEKLIPWVCTCDSDIDYQFSQWKPHLTRENVCWDDDKTLDCYVGKPCAWCLQLVFHTDEYVYRVGETEMKCEDGYGCSCGADELSYEQWYELFLEDYTRKVPPRLCLGMYIKYPPSFEEIQTFGMRRLKEFNRLCRWCLE